MTQTKSNKYLLINKTIFFPKEGILTFGDLHLGYENLLKNQGLSIPIKQLAETKKELKDVFNILERKNLKIKKIVILGDIKHYFPYKREEGFEVYAFLKFLDEKIGEENVVIIKGNHDKIELGKRKYKNYYIKEDIAFLHGDKMFQNILDKKIKYIIMGHIHPAILLTEGIKKEKYKAYLIGKWKNKTLIIAPSFHGINEGTTMNGHYKDIEDFSIVTKKQLQKFQTFIVGKDKIYAYKKLKEIN